jgi:RNA polymerase sigma factor (sigma-70 family)
VSTLAEDRGLDLNPLQDEALVVLAKECGYQPAETALVLRYRGWSGSLVGGLARQRGLSAVDTEDAVQDAVFGILKAIARYDTLQLGRANGCSFAAFLRRVLTDRFKDFLKHLWRVQKRYRCSLTAAEDDGGDGGPAPCEAREADPAQAAARAEWQKRFREVLAQLDASERELVDVLLSGVTVRAAADRLAISYDKAKRRWRKLRADLARRLPEPVA